MPVCFLKFVIPTAMEKTKQTLKKQTNKKLLFRHKRAEGCLSCPVATVSEYNPAMVLGVRALPDSVCEVEAK